MDYLYARHEAIMADSTLQSQYLQELNDIITSFDEKGTQNFRPFRIHRVVQTVKYNSFTGRLDCSKGISEKYTIFSYLPDDLLAMT